ncbi:PREDICTED: serine/arginine repetitive matrix protein 2-like [Nelumbo nucifera]|uniref:Serine/arginine repetitive matrix protein 2-like n=1 Tax=Nelumbo nucifera TaxID=4432 RepID=A0A1U8A026_NELNU|nr:PREDICTED: serine/arginine repetitive matrix protein 2-like [Nelumbo nucifera]XP_010258015.1 PREDICTED: serine/arginine repetitive matrix protein 2-like [Nelumbo nucifera]XP_010258016.1 PREDICTED: serine/arginine repetitive matrix protein 2-like [Nelumbo nucifera]XP_010258017.1 PREDICTED: serine/arginine repetitive matrix protein 2-like [Nelumbo nucifera]XP_010258018.1 PREDICTED: serine/arginine repetitive matrix protein 2-like [Nelumbo nucifera]
MYGQENYAPQFRPGPATNPQFQQGPAPPPYQQSLPALPPTVIQQGHLAPPPHVVQPGPPPVYGSPALAPPIQQGRSQPPLLQQVSSMQVPPPATVNIGQSFLHPPSSVHGSSPMMPTSSTAPQSSQYSSTLTSTNMHHVPPPVPPPIGPSLTGTSHLEMVRGPILPRVLPPPPSQGQMLYRTPIHPPLAGNSQGPQNIQLLRPPPPSSFVPVTPAPFASFGHSPIEDAHPPSMPPPPPPPPPSSPPPLPPSPPPSSSPPNHSVRTNNVQCSDKCIDSSVGPVDYYVDKTMCPSQTTDDMLTLDSHLNGKGATGATMESVAEDGLSSEEQITLDLPTPPPKPENEEVVRRIEVLCQFIAKNGHHFEEMARKNESGNPDFAFLFGGDSGSEAAIAHEYFQWVKRKLHLESRSCNESEQCDSSFRHSECESSMRAIDEGASHSPADSDMDMEDDVNQSDKEQEFGNMNEGLNGEPISLYDVTPVVKEQLHAPQCSIECPTARASVLDEEQKEHDSSASGRPSTKHHGIGMDSDGAAKCTPDTSLQKSASTVLEMCPTRASPATSGIGHKEVPGLLIKGGSPFRLIQDYASDDSPDDDDNGPCLEDVSPVRVSPSATMDAKSLHNDAETNLDTAGVSGNVSVTTMEFTSVNESVVVSPVSMPVGILDVSPEPLKVSEAILIVSSPPDVTPVIDELSISKHGKQTSSDQAVPPEPFKQKDALHDDRADIDPQEGKLHKEDTQQASTPLKVDEFGRLVREGASDSDSDGSRYDGRRKRGRSRSRSRSPPGRRRRRRSRSPWRRREKRSRSRSWSPKKQRSRSRSPAFRRMTEFGGEKMRRDRGQVPECFDFLRGRCYRGASCRYLHHDSAIGDGPRHHRTRQQHLEISLDSRRGEVIDVQAKTSIYDHDDVTGQESQSFRDSSVLSTGASKEEGFNGKTETVSESDCIQLMTSNEIGQLETLTGAVGQSESSEEVKVQEQQVQRGQVELSAQQPVETLEPLKVDNFTKEYSTDAEIQNLPLDVSEVKPSMEESSMPQTPKTSISVSAALPVLEDVANNSQQNSSSLIPHPLPAPSSTSLPCQLPMDELQPNMTSTQPYPNPTSMSQPCPPEDFAPQYLAPKEFQPPSSLDGEHQLPPFNLPPPPPLPQDLNTVGASFQSQTAPPVESFPPYQAAIHDPHSHLPPPPRAPWTSLPGPPSYVNESTPSLAIQTPAFRPVLFQQNSPRPRNDFPSQALTRPYPHEENTQLHPRIFPPIGDPHRPPLHTEDFRSKPLPVDGLQDQPLRGPIFGREERYIHSAISEASQFHPPPQPEYHLHARPQLRQVHHVVQPVRDDVPSYRVLQNQRFSSQFPVQGSQLVSFPAENLPPRPFSRDEFGALSTGNLSYSEHRQPSYGLQPSVTDAFSSQLGAPGKVDPSISRYSSFLDSSRLSCLSEVGGSRISKPSHYNPFASTFEQSVGSSKFSSNFVRDIDTNYTRKYDFPYGLSHVSMDGQHISDLGSRQTTSSPDSNRLAGQILPRSGSSLPAPLGELNDRVRSRGVSAEVFPGTQTPLIRESTTDQYDPLFDSIEPSSSSIKKLDHLQERDSTTNVVKPLPSIVNDSEAMLRLSSSHKLPTAEEDTKLKKDSASTAAKSPENDEFGETAMDAEVGVVENESPEPGDGKNWSPGNPNDQANPGTGEIEIDQVQTSGKSKKSKDSRSMRLFKIALANFVKEVLKPSWRQGNMSKEAFKTIVKKTVDKVSGAMKSHQIPKSQAKIDRYVESSQRKLTKLVMGYVDKYVKV